MMNSCYKKSKGKIHVCIIQHVTNISLGVTQKKNE